MQKIDPNFSMPSIDGVLDWEKQKTWNSHLGRSLTEAYQLLAYRVNKLMPKDGSEGFDGVITVGGFPVITRIKVTTFTASGTFTPDPDMLYGEATAWGNGGGGAGSPATAAGTIGMGSGGNAGAKAVLYFDNVSLVGAQTVTIGGGGAGGVGNADGTAGAAVTLGSLLSAAGGEGGGSGGAASTGVLASPNASSQSATGTIRGWTFQADSGNRSTTAGVVALIVQSGRNELGGSVSMGSNANGPNAPANTGAGGGGTTNGFSQSARTGGTGGSGFMVLREWLR